MIALLLFAAAAASFQDVAGLDRAVAGFTGREIGAEGGARAPVDPRLRLTPCPMVSLAWRTAARDAVVVACTAPADGAAWRIFVPVVMPSRAAATGAGAGPSAPAPGARIIRRGDPLTIEAGSPGFSITREGVALGDAAAGERLLVRVDNARAPVQAVAVEAGRATLPGWKE